MAAEVPGRRRARREGQGSARRAGRVADRRRTTRSSARTWPIASGRTSSGAASSIRWTTCASAIRPAISELLEELGKRLADYNFDMKKLIRDICTSRTYQLSAVANDSNRDDDSQFSHARLRRLRADVLLDSISEATEAPTHSAIRRRACARRSFTRARGAPTATS